MDKATILSNLDIDLDDNDNFTFTPEEKARAVDEAWRDQWNTVPVWDETTVYDVNTYTYTVPTTLDTVKDFWYKGLSTDFPKRLPVNAVDRIGANLYISSSYRYRFTTGGVICIRGNHKVAITESCAEDRIEYILMLSRYNLLNRLAGKKVNKFLKNDTSMAEVQVTIQTLEKELARKRRAFSQATERG